MTETLIYMWIKNPNDSSFHKSTHIITDRRGKNSRNTDKDRNASLTCSNSSVHNAKHDVLPQCFCLVFQHKYLNILKSRYIYWRREMTEDIKGLVNFRIKIS